jgi:hypothetical protein
MTIAVAVTYGGGVIFCSDRLITHGDASYPQAFSHYEQKIDGFIASPKSSIAMCGATDNFDVMRSVFQEVRKHYHADQPQKNPPLKLTLEKVLEEVISRPQSAIPSIDLLFAQTVLEGPTNLYKCTGPHVTLANQFECVGIGDTSLIRYLQDNAFEPGMSTNMAKTFAIYVVHMAKQYVPQYCGGETDVWEISDGFCKEANPRHVHSVEYILQNSFKSPYKSLMKSFSSCWPAEP